MSSRGLIFPGLHPGLGIRIHPTHTSADTHAPLICNPHIIYTVTSQTHLPTHPRHTYSPDPLHTPYNAQTPSLLPLNPLTLICSDGTKVMSPTYWVLCSVLEDQLVTNTYALVSPNAKTLTCTHLHSPYTYSQV